VALLEKFRTAASRSADVGRRFDDRTLTWLAETPHGPLTPILRATSLAADLLMPWTGMATWWLRDGRPRLRHGAVRGWTAIALSALVEDTVIKPAIGRDRPPTRRLPARQRHFGQPSTSAFPSGHAGAATAFAVAASHDAPAWRALAVATAAVTTYSLVYTGRHYPTDAIVGVLIGAATGALVGQLEMPTTLR
jgi:membrane-associated phospholipid phosphatase